MSIAESLSTVVAAADAVELEGVVVVAAVAVVKWEWVRHSPWPRPTATQLTMTKCSPRTTTKILLGYFRPELAD
jgi:hypothetical protein